jgi:hypothetical protein
VILFLRGEIMWESKQNNNKNKHAKIAGSADSFHTSDISVLFDN